MKNLIRSLIVVLCSGALAFGVDAEKVKISVVKNLKSLSMHEASPPTGYLNMGKASTSKNRAADLKKVNPNKWWFVSIPLSAEAASRGDRVPDFIPELTVDIFLMFRLDDGGSSKFSPTTSLVLLKKSIDYVNIPIVSEKVKGKSIGKGEFNVGAFISPTDVSKLTVREKKKNEGGDGDLSKSLIGFAVEVRFEGTLCNDVEESPSDYFFDTFVKDKIQTIWPKWWQTSKIGDGDGIKLLCINETPFAPFYATLFPPTKVLFANTGAAKQESSSSSATDSEPAENTTSSSSRTTRSASSTSSSTSTTTRSAE